MNTIINVGIFSLGISLLYLTYTKGHWFLRPAWEGSIVNHRIVPAQMSAALGSMAIACILLSVTLAAILWVIALGLAAYGYIAWTDADWKPTRTIEYVHDAMPLIVLVLGLVVMTTQAG